MGSQSLELEQFFSVGAVTMLHTQPNRRDSSRFRTVLRGWKIHQHLILDRPRDANNAFAILEEGGSCVLRFLRDGQACACESQILAWDTHKNNPYVRLRWPKEISYTSFRQSERVPLKLACRVHWPDNAKTEEELRDLSAGGCSLFSTRTCSEGGQINVGVELPDGVHIKGVDGIVRNVRDVKGGFLLGIQFLGGQDIAKNDLTFFVTSTLARRREDCDNESRGATILLIDECTELFESLLDPLRRMGIELVWAGNLVDGLHRLRMLTPQGVLLNQANSALPGTEICRVVRRASGLEKIPLWVYGKAELDMGRRCKEAGATGFFPEGPTLVDDIIFGLAAVAVSRPKAS
jgi:c-di-GMP-binding flagellar brake protein YcgR